MRNKTKSTRPLAVILLLAITLGTLLPTLGKVSFWDSDEARYAECARNAIEHGHWIIPYYNGHPRIVKPPLMVWLVALSSMVINGGQVTEFSARLPSLLAGVGTVLITYLLAYSLLSSEVLAFLSAFILATTYLFYKQARFSITDMVLTFFFTLALYWFYQFYRGGRGLYVLGMYGALAMATMDKGPAVGFVLPVLIIILFIWMQGDVRKIKGLIHPVGILIYIALVLPWPLLVGKAYLVKFLWRSNVRRFANNPAWRTPFWFYLWNFPVHFTPWAAFLPLTAATVRKVRGRMGPISFPLIWFAVVFVLFSLSDTKRSSYILPLYPAAALITAWSIGKGIEMKEELVGPWRASLGLFALVIMGYVVALVLAFSRHVPLYTPTATASLGLALIIGGFIAFIAKLKNFQEGTLLACAGALVLTIGYTGFYQPLFDQYYRSPKPYCADIKKTVGSLPLYHYGSIRAHDLFYIGKGRIPSLPDAKEPKGPYFVMTRGKKLKSLRRERPYLKIIKRYPFRDIVIVLLRSPKEKHSGKGGAHPIERKEDGEETFYYHTHLQSA